MESQHVRFWQKRLLFLGAAAAFALTANAEDRVQLPLLPERGVHVGSDDGDPLDIVLKVVAMGNILGFTNTRRPEDNPADGLAA